MGFKRPVYKLTFADSTPYAGLEVTMRAPNIGELLQIDQLRAKAAQAGDVDAVKELFGVFAALLVAWNLEEDDGTAVPASHDEVMKLDAAMLNAVIDAWIERVAKVPPPLHRPSGTAQESPAVPPIPMTPLTPVSRAS
jgi:hypothetical protein